MTGPSLVCTSCQTPLPADAQFCPRCGAATPTQVSGDGTAAVASTPDRSAERQREIQTALGPDYVVEHRVGSGGFAEVWAATDRKLQRRVAVKVLHPELVASRSLIERFEREAQAVAKLRHPGVIPIYAVGRHEDLAYYVMPLVEGESLRDRLSREGALPPDEARRILKETAAALAVAHEAGIVHRDIKPENLMLEGKERRVLVMDFGIAKSTAGAQTGLTGTGMIIGTPAYMSPEQAMGSKEIDARSDVYSLGIVGFELLTGKPPFKADSVPELIVQHVTAEAPSLRSVAPGVPEDLVVAIDRCLAKDPAQRWMDAGAFAASLTDAARIVAAVPRKRFGLGAGRVAAIGGAALGVSAVAAVVLWAPWKQRETMGPDVTPRQVTFRGDVCQPFISPSGRYVAFFAAHQQWLLDLERDRSWPVSDTLRDADCETGGVPPSHWRANDTGLLYVSGDSVWEAGIDSGRARAVGPRQAWDSLAMLEENRRGSVVDMVRTQPGDTLVWALLAPGRPPRILPVSGFLYHMGAMLSPDGSRVYSQVRFADSTLGYALLNLDAGRMAVLKGDIPGDVVEWSREGTALYADLGSQAGILRVEVDTQRLSVTGRRTLLLPGLAPDFILMGWKVASGRNRILLDRRTPSSARVLVARWPSADPRPRLSLEAITPGSLRAFAASLSPEDDRLLFIAKVDSVVGLFEMTLPGGVPRRVARLPGTAGWGLRLSPDGSMAIVATRHGDRWHATLVDVRSGATRDLVGWAPARGVLDPFYPTFDWDPSGRVVYAFDNVEDLNGSRIVRLNAMTGAADTLRADSTTGTYCPAASPDGKWLAVASVSRAGRLGVLLLPLADDSIRHLGPPRQQDACPLGWLNTHQLVVLERPSPTSGDSAEVWAYDVSGSRTVLGKMPPGRCYSPALAPTRTTVACIILSGFSRDIWIADDFDPYYHPSRASIPRR